MKQNDSASCFKTKLLRPAGMADDTLRAFVVLPKTVSDTLPRRGRTTVVVSINDHEFQITLEPDGQLSHWLQLDKSQLETAGISVGEVVTFLIRPVEHEPEPEIPFDLEEALAVAPEARAAWEDTTTIARVDWIHWIVTAKQAKTRVKRINDACEQLASGKRRVCCFDPSGFYSKALKAPGAAE